MVIGVDLGGSKIRVGVVQNGRLLQVVSSCLKEKDQLQSTLTQLMDLIRKVFSIDVEGIGIGVPSVVDVSNGVVYDVVNIPSWKEVYLKDLLQNCFHVDVAINNDVNCFVLGEYLYGKAKGTESLVGITIGTGLGAGLILNGELYMGANCGSGEIGMLPYNNSILEEYVGSRFFLDRSGKEAKVLQQEALNGDSNAQKLWNEFGMHLGNAIMMVMYTYDPDKIVIGGSISKAFPLYASSMYQTMQKFAYKESLKRMKIEVSDMDNVALLGAASLLLK